MKDKLKADLEAARARSREKTSPEHTAEVKRLQRELAAHLAEGADPCPKCGALPHGMEQPTAQGVEVEIGCLSCPKTRVRGKTQRAAVLLWNGQEYLP